MMRLRFQNYFSFYVCVFLLILSIQGGAQPVSFIHIQTENNQSYEVEWSGTKYPSTAKGYLVIPQVQVGKHVLTIEFSDETGLTSSYTFSVDMTDKPRGFSLRQAVDNSWSLFDMIDLTLLQGVLVPPVVKTVIPDKAPDPVYTVVKEDKPVAIIPVVKKETVIVNKEKTIIKPTAIIKIFDKSGANGIDQVYILTVGNRSDTIALFIPVITEKNEPATGSNPSVWLHPGSFKTGTMDKIRPPYLVPLSK